MVRARRDGGNGPTGSCVVCVVHGLDAPAEVVRMGPVRIGASLIRAALAVGIVLVGALLTPDPRDLEPQVLSRV